MPDPNVRSFDDILREGRQKKRNQDLAQRILGHSRHSSAPAPRNRKNTTAVGSLASRAGVSKSAASTPKPSFGSRLTNGTQLDLLNESRRINNPHLAKKSRVVQNALTGIGGSPLRAQANFRVSNGSKGIAIRGMGSAVTVVAQNFAPGTTATDIEAVMFPEGDQSALISCKIISSKPTVIAELVYSRKEAADEVVSTYNNRQADGRLLHLWVKDPAPYYPRIRSGPRGSSHAIQSSSLDHGDMDIDEDAEEERPREQAHALKAQPEFADGRYGFAEPSASARQEDRSSDDYQDYEDDRAQVSKADRGGRDYDNRDRSYDRDYDRYEADRRGRGSRGGGLASDEILRRDRPRSGRDR